MLKVARAVTILRCSQLIDYALLLFVPCVALSVIATHLKDRVLPVKIHIFGQGKKTDNLRHSMSVSSVGIIIF